LPDVRSGEIQAVEQQRLGPQPGQGVGKAVSEIETCRVASFAVGAERLSGKLHLLRIDGHNLKSRPVQK
jgi:hypothetical protein